MPDKPGAPRRNPLVAVFAALALLAAIAWLIAGFVGCKHAGLV